PGWDDRDAERGRRHLRRGRRRRAVRHEHEPVRRREPAAGDLPALRPRRTRGPDHHERAADRADDDELGLRIARARSRQGRRRHRVDRGRARLRQPPGTRRAGRAVRRDDEQHRVQRHARDGPDRRGRGRPAVPRDRPRELGRLLHHVARDRDATATGGDGAVSRTMARAGRRRVAAVATTAAAAACALAALLPGAALGAATTAGTVAFESNRAGNFDIFTMTATGGGQARLTTDPADDLDPAWSPDGRRIAFASRRGGATHIWVMNADGSAQTQATSAPGADRYPTWSPDGTRIAFRHDTGAQSDVWVADATGEHPLTTGALADQPAWSPDGTRIAFVSTRDGNDEVYVMGADGSGQRDISVNPASDRSPHWSADSAHIIFRSLRDPAEGRELFVMASDGSGQAPFASSPG